MKTKLDNIELEVSKKLFGKTTKIKFNGKTISVRNQTISKTINILKSNYELIKAHYISNLSKSQIPEIDNAELNTLCVNILFFYIDQYSRWKEQYKKSNYEITFYEKDFDHPTTHDIIIFFMQEKHPENWESISAKYIKMERNIFNEYWINRQAYFNK